MKTNAEAATIAPVAASAAPCDEQGAGHQQRKHDHGGVGVKAVQHDQRRAEQIGRERAGRDRLDAALLRRRAEHESAYHQQRREDKSGDDVEGVRRDHRRPALQAGEGPQRREHDGRDRKPAPQPDAREAEGGGGDDGEIKIQRPEIRLLGGDQDRRRESGGDAEAGQRRPVQQRRGQGAQRHHAEQNERRRRDEEIIQRVGGVDGGERHRGAGGGEDGRDVGDRQRLDRSQAFLAPGPFAGGKQRQREQAAEQHAHARSEQALFDRIADQEETAQRQRQAADPDHPAGADTFLEAGTGLRRRRGNVGYRRRRCRWNRRALLQWFQC